MSSTSRTLRSRPVPLTASLTFSTKTVGVNALAGALTQPRIRFVASARTRPSFTAAAALFSPLSPMMLRASIWVSACSCRVLRDPVSKLLSPMPSVAARAMSAGPAVAATALGTRTVTRRCPRLRSTRPAACSALRSRTRSNSAGFPKPSRTVHLLGALPKLWTGSSSMNLPRNSWSASSCVTAPFNFLSRATASAGTVDSPSKIGRMSASASAFSGAMFSSRACMRPPLPLANVPYSTCRDRDLTCITLRLYDWTVQKLDGAFAALADPTRREILHRLSRQPQPAGALSRGFRMSQPAVSKHLRVLREVSLVEVEEQGRQRIYRLSKRGSDDVRDYG